jgi:hypothetical protein
LKPLLPAAQHVALFHEALLRCPIACANRADIEDFGLAALGRDLAGEFVGGFGRRATLIAVLADEPIKCSQFIARQFIDRCLDDKITAVELHMPTIFVNQPAAPVGAHRFMLRTAGSMASSSRRATRAIPAAR